MTLIGGTYDDRRTVLADTRDHPQAMFSARAPFRVVDHTTDALSMTIIVNLGCGNKTHPRCLNYDWSIYARLKRNPVGRRLAPVVFNGARLAQYEALSENVVVHDLRRGIPLDDASADAVYHSHVLEHIDRDHVDSFLGEIRRVLRPGGIHRVVVPDMERYAREYLASLERALADSSARETHDAVMSQMLLQMVRREAYGTSQQRPLRRRLENLALGDARRRGETHMWMWDRINLTVVLEATGFRDVKVVDWQTSMIPDWNSMALDQHSNGREYKPESLYVEALR